MSNTDNKKSTLLPWIICGLAAVFYCYEYLLRVSPSVMMPELMRTFGVSAASLGVLSSFYYYAYTPIQLPVGLMMDRYGPRRILTMAVLACAIGAGLFGATGYLSVAIIGRFLMGFGSAFAFVGVLKLATIWLPPDRFALVAGLATTLGMLGAISGEVLLSRMVGLVGWEQAIIFSGLFGLILAPLIWFIVRDKQPGAPEPIKKNRSYREFGREFVDIISNRQIWLNGFIGSLLFIPITVFAELWGVEYLKTVYQIDVEHAAWSVSLIFLGWAIGGPIMGAWSDRIKQRKLPILCGSLICTAVLSILMTTPDLSMPVVYSLLFAVGFFGSVQVIVFAIARENCPLHLAGTALATTNFFIMLGGAIFQPLVGKILDATSEGATLNGTHVYSADSYQLAMLMLPAAVLIAFLLSAFLKETSGNTQ